jgi:hypothetical protein
MSTMGYDRRLSTPGFNEFVFYCIMSATNEQRQRLPFYLFNQATSKTKAKIFADKASMERKIQMLAYLGINFSLWFTKGETMNLDELMETLNGAADKLTRLTTQRRMIENKSFVFTDREVMAALHTKAQICHNDSFTYDRDYYKITKDLVAVDHDRSNSIEEAKSAMSEYKLLSKFLLALLMHKDHIDGLSVYKELELSIMLYLLIHRHTWVDQKAIAIDLTPPFTKNSIVSTLIRLRHRALIDRLPAKEKNVVKYTLTGLGTQIIGDYVRRCVNQAFRD